MLVTTLRGNNIYGKFIDLYNHKPFLDTPRLKLYDVDGVTYANHYEHDLLVLQQYQVKGTAKKGVAQSVES